MFNSLADMAAVWCKFPLDFVCFSFLYNSGPTL